MVRIITNRTPSGMILIVNVVPSLQHGRTFSFIGIIPSFFHRVDGTDDGAECLCDGGIRIGGGNICDRRIGPRVYAENDEQINIG